MLVLLLMMMMLPLLLLLVMVMVAVLLFWTNNFPFRSARFAHSICQHFRRFVNGIQVAFFTTFFFLHSIPFYFSFFLYLSFSFCFVCVLACVSVRTFHSVCLCVCLILHFRFIRLFIILGRTEEKYTKNLHCVCVCMRVL